MHAPNETRKSQKLRKKNATFSRRLNKQIPLVLVYLKRSNSRKVSDTAETVLLT